MPDSGLDGEDKPAAVELLAVLVVELAVVVLLEVVGVVVGVLQGTNTSRANLKIK